MERCSPGDFGRESHLAVWGPRSMMPGRSNRTSDGQVLSGMAVLLTLTVEQGDISYRLRSTIVYIHFVQTPCKSAWATA